MFYFVRLFRVTIYEGRLPYVGELTSAIVVAFVVLLVGFFIFSRKSSEFGYRL